MKKILLFLITLVLTMIIVQQPPVTAHSSLKERVIPPIVSTEWLSENLDLPGLIVLDIRSPEEYNAGHIPGSINAPSGLWYVNPPFGADLPWMEAPPVDYLFKLIGNAGITEDSFVVIVGSTSGPLAPLPLALYRTADACRVAVTLLYADVRNVAILDGGYEKWIKEGRPISKEPVKPQPKTYTGVVKAEMFVKKEYVAARVGKAIIVDARDLEVYLGFIQEPWTARRGHIPTARNIPAPWLWNIKINPVTGEAEYVTYKDTQLLKTIVGNIVGMDLGQEIIVYCGIGGYASPMYFVLKEVLGYTNVKIYDGSAQEWTGDMALPVVYEDIGSEYLSLQNLYRSLSQTFSSLQVGYTTIESDYIVLKNKYAVLEGEYKKIKDKYENLEREYNRVKGEYGKIESEYRRLRSEYDELKAGYEELSKTTAPLYLTIIFIATTVIFLALSMYLLLRLKILKK